MLSFTHVPQAYPAKRAAEARAHDFGEIAPDYLVARAEEQSGRCSQCGVPFCQVHCPLHNHIPDWLRLTADGRLREAYELSASTSTMPEICGRICPQDRLCEGNCVIEGSGHGAVTIGSVEKFIGDTAWENGWVAPLRPLRDRGGQSVGIIGAGPAGLTAAEYLRVRGYAVSVYDRHDRPGGLLTYGIPGFKLEKHVVERRTRRLADGGIAFHQEFDVGRDASFAELQRRHDALLIATGVYGARALGLGVADNLLPALDYLFASNRAGFGAELPASHAATGKRVVVIGGGDTAMDCVRTAIRQGAAAVTCLYRRDRTNMPGSAREVAHAEEEGVRFEWLAAPAALIREGARVVAVDANRMRLGAADATGRAQPLTDPQAKFRVAADLVVEALGFDAEDLPGMWDTPELAVTRWGTLRMDHKTMMTSLPGVFAAGDIVRGASLVVWAVRDGRDVAERMHNWLQGAAAGGKERPAALLAA